MSREARKITTNVTSIRPSQVRKVTRLRPKQVREGWREAPRESLREAQRLASRLRPKQVREGWRNALREAQRQTSILRPRQMWEGWREEGQPWMAAGSSPGETAVQASRGGTSVASSSSVTYFHLV